MQAVTKLTPLSSLQCGVLFLCSVLLSACGGGSGSGSPSSSTTPASTSSNISLVLNAARIDTQQETLHVAPYAITFDAFGSTTTASSGEPAVSGMTADRSAFRNIKYTWDFGEQTSYGKTATWGYGPKAGSALKNVAYGPVVAHVFEAAGTKSDGSNEADGINTYTVTLTAFDGVNTTVKTKTFTVVGQNYQFANSTLCVSNTVRPTAGGGGCPAGAATQLMPNWSSLSTLTQTYKRVLLRRGDVWSMDNTATISVAGPGLIGAFGDSSVSLPQVSMDVNGAAFNLTSAALDWRLVDVDITTNGVAGTSKQAVVTNGALVRNSTTGAQTGPANNILALRLNVHNVFFGFNALNQDGLYIVDSVVNGTFAANNGIGGYVDNIDHLAMLGVKITNIPGNHGFRVQGTRYSVISNSEFSNTDGISLTVRGNTDASLTYTSPADGLLYVPWDHVWAEKIVVSDNSIGKSSGSAYAFYAGPQSVGHAERLRDMVFERNYVSNDVLEAANFAVASGLVVRNNIMLTRYDFALGVGMSGNRAGTPVMDSMYVYNNDFYKVDTTLRPAFSGIVFNNTGNVGTGLVVENNIAYGAGNRMDGATNGSQASFSVATSAGLLGSSLGGGNYYMSNNSTDAQVNTSMPWYGGASYAASAAAQYFALASGSYALVGAGTAVPVWDDFLFSPFNSSSQRPLGPIAAVGSP